MPIDHIYDDVILQILLSRRIITEDGHWLFSNWNTKSRPQKWYNGKTWEVSRLYLKLTNSDFKESLQVNHSCNNEMCWNPEHVYLGTQTQNRNDAIELGTWQNQNSKKVFCKNGHVLEALNHRSNWRVCKICRNVGQNKNRNLNKLNKLLRGIL